MSTIFICGVSLGANNCPVVAAKLNGHRDVSLFGFQASLFGNKQPLTANVKFATEAVSDNPLNGGLGAYRWEKGDGPDPRFIQNVDAHPGDGNTFVQDAFLSDMRKLMDPAKPTYLFGMYGLFGQTADPVNFVTFLRRVTELGIHVMHSPYRDFQTQLIVDQAMALPQ